MFFFLRQNKATTCFLLINTIVFTALPIVNNVNSLNSNIVLRYNQSTLHDYVSVYFFFDNWKKLKAKINYFDNYWPVNTLTLVQITADSQYTPIVGDSPVGGANVEQGDFFFFIQVGKMICFCKDQRENALTVRFD